MSLKTANKTHSKHYGWGANCDAWFFLKSDKLSVIRETMPAGSSETVHFHNKSQQFFYIIDGVATFEVDGKNVVVRRDEGIHIKPGVQHRIVNNSNADLNILVISEPHSHEDRVNV